MELNQQEVFLMILPLIYYFINRKIIDSRLCKKLLMNQINIMMNSMKTEKIQDFEEKFHLLVTHLELLLLMIC